MTIPLHPRCLGWGFLKGPYRGSWGDPAQLILARCYAECCWVKFVDRRWTQLRSVVKYLVSCIALCCAVCWTQHRVSTKTSQALQGRTRGQPVTGKSVQGPPPPLSRHHSLDQSVPPAIFVPGPINPPSHTETLTCCDNFWRLIKLCPGTSSRSSSPLRQRCTEKTSK